jgi:hypothetical protein
MEPRLAEENVVIVMVFLQNFRCLSCSLPADSRQMEDAWVFQRYLDLGG